MSHRFPGAAVLLPSAAAFVLCVEAAFGAAVKVTKSGQGIYAKPDETKKAATLPVGTVMEVRNASSAPQGWVQVAVPACVDLWIFSDSVNNGVVTVTTGRIRSTPGPMEPEVGRIPRGGSVTIRGRNKDWFKIAPPASATMWVKTDSVTATSEAPARIEETSVEVDGPQSAAPAILPPVIPMIPPPVATSTPQTPSAPTPPPPPPAPTPAPVVPEVSVASVATPPPPPVVPAPVPVPPEPVAAPTPPEPIIPAWQPPETPEAAVASTRSADKPEKPANKPVPVVEKPADKPSSAVGPSVKPVAHTVAVTPTTRPVAVTPTTRPVARPVVFPAKPAARPTRPHPLPAPKTYTPATPAPVASGVSWEKPTPSAPHGRNTGTPAAHRHSSVAESLAGRNPTQTFLPKELNDVEWSDPNPGTLLPNRRPAAVTVPVPEAIADEKLSTTYVQGKAGRAVGLLVHDEGGLFRGSRYEVLALSDDGTASERLAIVIGDPVVLNPLVDRAVRIDGTVWWLRGSTPLLVVDTILPR